MRFFWLFTILILSVCCDTKKNKQNNEVIDSVTREQNNKDRQVSYNQFNQDSFNFSVKLPTTWTSATNTVGNMRILNLFPVQDSAQLNLPLKIHEKPELSHVSFFPDGYGVELPAGKSLSLDTYDNEPQFGIKLNQPESRVFMLENDNVYAYFLVPSAPPSNWGKHGFIFAQIAIDDFSATCVDESGKKLDMKACDPMAGDVIKKKGTVRNKEQQIVRSMLSSITFQQDESPSAVTTDLIKVNEPVPDDTISSPFEIAGEARGQWYFEGDFPIKLLDAQGEKISESYATAQDAWMTEDFVSFTASMDFSVDENQKGSLVLEKANPSGLPENADSVRIPVHLSINK